MRTTVRNTSLIVLLGIVMLPAVGCVSPPTPQVFDKAAVDNVRCVMVAPLICGEDKDPAAGPIAATSMQAALQTDRPVNLTVVEPPQLWLLEEGKGPAARNPISTEQALQIAKEMGADAVLTGSADYLVTLTMEGSVLEIFQMGSGTDESGEILEYQQDFSRRKGSAAVEVKLLLTDSGREIYAHRAEVEDMPLGNWWALRAVMNQAFAPLREYLKTSRVAKK